MTFTATTEAEWLVNVQTEAEQEVTRTWADPLPEDEREPIVITDEELWGPEALPDEPDEALPHGGDVQ